MIEPDDFLKIAADLAPSDEEAYRRTAVSRVYYAAFHVCRAQLRDAGIHFKRAADAHEHVYRCLNNCGSNDIAKVAATLNQLRGFRVRLGQLKAFVQTELPKATSDLGMKACFPVIATLKGDPTINELPLAKVGHGSHVQRL